MKECSTRFKCQCPLIVVVGKHKIRQTEQTNRRAFLQPLTAFSQLFGLFGFDSFSQLLLSYIDSHTLIRRTRTSYKTYTLSTTFCCLPACPLLVSHLLTQKSTTEREARYFNLFALQPNHPTINCISSDRSWHPRSGEQSVQVL